MTCPTPSPPPEAAERALWTCAEAAVDTAVFALALCFGLLAVAQFILVYFAWKGMFQ